MNEIQNKEDEQQSIENKIGELPQNKVISLHHVYFTYDGSDRDYVLDDVCLTIPHDRVTAIVGASRSGKTTLVIISSYCSQRSMPNKGKIHVGNIPLEDINPYLWRASTGAVMQESFIFSDTIAANIAIGEDVIDKTRLAHAATITNISEFIQSI